MGDGMRILANVSEPGIVGTCGLKGTTATDPSMIM